MLYFNKIERVKKLAEEIKKLEQENSKVLLPEIEKDLLLNVTRKSIFWSRKVWFTLVGITVPFLNSLFDLGLCVVELSFIGALLVSYIIAQGIADRR